MHILVELDGVLRTRNDQVLPTGVLMVGTLTVYNSLTIMSADSNDHTVLWLNQNKIVDYDGIIDRSVGLTDEELSHRQIKFARSQGKVDLFITSNPELWAFAFNLGIPSVMFGVPEYLRPEFRPDAPKALRSWDQISKAIHEQNEHRTKDARVLRTESLNFE